MSLSNLDTFSILVDTPLPGYSFHLGVYLPGWQAPNQEMVRFLDGRVPPSSVNHPKIAGRYNTLASTFLVFNKVLSLHRKYPFCKI